MTRRSSVRLLRGVPAGLLVVVSLWEVAVAWRANHSTPSDDAWRQAAAVVRAGYRPGDLIVFAPDWIDPVGRLHLGDLMPIEMVARMDAATYGRLWELSIRGARAPETAGLPATATTEIAGVTVRRFERSPAVVVADVLDYRPTTDGVAPSLELAEVGFAPHRCFQVTPVPGRPVRITFPQVPLGTALVGYVGLADVFTRRDIRAPGSLTVEVAGKVVATASASVDDGWVRFEAATSPGTADVTFVASASAPQRQLCFAAEARR